MRRGLVLGTAVAAFAQILVGSAACNRRDLDRREQDRSSARAASESAGIRAEENRKLPPIPPSGLRAETAGGGVRLSWNPTGLDRVVRYEVWRERGRGPAVLAGAVEADADNEILRRTRYEFEDSSALEPGTYSYWIVAIDLYGNASEEGERVEAVRAP